MVEKVTMPKWWKPTGTEVKTDTGGMTMIPGASPPIGSIPLNITNVPIQPTPSPPRIESTAPAGSGSPMTKSEGLGDLLKAYSGLFEDGQEQTSSSGQYNYNTSPYTTDYYGTPESQLLYESDYIRYLNSNKFNSSYYNNSYQNQRQGYYPSPYRNQNYRRYNNYAERRYYPYNYNNQYYDSYSYGQNTDRYQGNGYYQRENYNRYNRSNYRYNRYPNRMRY
jgi:hypothetical protein